MKKLSMALAFFVMASHSLPAQSSNPAWTSAQKSNLSKRYFNLFFPTYKTHHSPEWNTFKMTKNGKDKGYIIVKPINYHVNNNRRHKVIVFLSGQGMPLLSTEMITGLVKKCENNGTILVVVAHTYTGNGDERNADTVESLYNDNRFSLWRDDTVNQRSEIYQDIKMLDIISTKIRQDLTSNDNVSKVDTNRIYLCGYSSGAILTQYAAMTLNHKFAAFASNAGHANQNISSFNPRGRFRVPIILFSATSDENVLYNESDTCGANILQRIDYLTGRNSVREWYRINGGNKSVIDSNCPGKPNMAYTIIDPVKDDGKKVHKYQYSDPFEFYKIIGGGHHWHSDSGFCFNPPFTYLPCSTMCKDINTTNLILSFFDRQAKSKNGSIPYKQFPIPNLNLIKSASVTASVNNIDLDEYKIFHSSEGTIEIEVDCKGKSNYIFLLTNLNGQILAEQTMTCTEGETHKTTLNASPTLIPNVYFIQILRDGERIGVEKFIKQ